LAGIVAARGRLITLEGGEGSGKSTQAERLGRYLMESGIDNLVTREPGGSPGAEQIRELLLTGAVSNWDGVEEALLVAAARRNHVERTIRPALARGAWVICDRFFDSTEAYQGAGRGVDAAAISALRHLAIGNLAPDLTLICDVPVDIGLSRAAARRAGITRFERLDLAFHERVRAAFLDIARREPERCVVIDAARPADRVFDTVKHALAERLA